VKHKIFLAIMAVALFILAIVGALQTSASWESSSASPTVGQTLQAADMHLPTKPSQVAAVPTDWSTRVQFKGCGQKASVRTRVGKKLLLYNAGTVVRYVRSLGGIPIDLPIGGGRTMAPHDFRELTFSLRGQYVLTFTTPYCTLWAPKIIVAVS
jgi:hypothetical protein